MPCGTQPTAWTELPRWNEHDAMALEALDSLKSLFDDACARYETRKRELAALDYLDLELKTEELLRSHTRTSPPRTGVAFAT